MSRRRYRSRSSGGAFAALIALLIIVGLVIKFIWWIIGVVALVALFYLVRAVVRENRNRRDATAQYQASVAARADQQHRWVMQGDDRGIYGPNGAPLMHYIECGGTPATSTAEQPAPARWRIGPFGTRFAQ